MKPQLDTPNAWPLHSEQTTIVRRGPREHRCGAGWFLVGAALVLGPVVAWRYTVLRPHAAPPPPDPRGIVLHATAGRMWIDGVRVDAASLALPCGTHSLRAEAADPPLLLDVSCHPTVP